MSDRWRGWSEEDVDRRAYYVATWVVLAVIAVAAAVGTVTNDGLESAWLWVGLALVPVLLWLVKAAGLYR